MSKLALERFSDSKAHWAAPHRQVFCQARRVSNHSGRQENQMCFEMIKKDCWQDAHSRLGLLPSMLQLLEDASQNQHDKDTVVLFRACCEHLGPHAAASGCFRGSPCYEKDRTRMMWFDTSFLVAMRKSCWGEKKGREVVLAIWVKRSFFEDCLGSAVCSDTLRSSKAHGGGGSCGGNGGGRSGSGSIASGNSSRGGSLGPFSTLGDGGGGGDAGGGNSNQSADYRHSSPASSVAGSPPASPASEQLRRWRQQQQQQQQRREAFALGGDRENSDGDYGHAAADTPAAALLAKGKMALGEGDRDVNVDGDGEGGRGAEDRDDNDGDGEVRERAVTGDPTKRDYFGGPFTGSGGTGAPGRRPRSQSLSSPRNSGRTADGVRLHWEPERLPSGEKHRTRRVVQLGLKGRWLQMLGSGDAVVRIERLDGLLAEQRAALASSAPQNLTVPVARALDVGHLQDAQLTALHLVSERARPKLRILCLHGYLQNSRIFSQRTRQLSKKLKNTAELVYVDAPHLLREDELPPPLPSLPSSPLEEAATKAAAAAAAAVAKLVNTGEGGALGVVGDGDDGSPLPTLPASPTLRRKTLAQSTAKSAGGERAGRERAGFVSPDRAGARTWWRCDAEERKRAKAVRGMAGRCEWKGVEDSLAFLRKVWDQQGPFDGLLGFSQGAAMASIFNHCAFAGERSGGREEQLAGIGGDLGVFAMPLLPPPRFAVFISGCFQPHPTQIPSYPLPQEQPQEKLPSLHVWAVEDRFVPASQSQRLAGMYLRSSVFMHRGSHSVPQIKEVVPNFIRFLEDLR